MLSSSDTKKLFRLLAAASVSPCPYYELATGTGIITEQRARADILALISGAGRTSTYDVAATLGLDPRVVEQRLLPAEDGWGRVGGSTIVKTGEFARLRAELAELLRGGVVGVTEFCRSTAIDRELMMRLLPPGCEWLAGERECVYGTGYFEDAKDAASRVLAAATG